MLEYHLDKIFSLTPLKNSLKRVILLITLLFMVIAASTYENARKATHKVYTIIATVNEAG